MTKKKKKTTHSPPLHPPPQCCPTSTTTFHSLLKETGWHFKSLLFCLSRHWLLWEALSLRHSLNAFQVICIEVVVKEHIESQSYSTYSFEPAPFVVRLCVKLFFLRSRFVWRKNLSIIVCLCWHPDWKYRNVWEKEFSPFIMGASSIPP